MIQVCEIRQRRDFIQLEAEWNAFADSCRASLEQRHEYLRLFLDSFHPEWRGVRILIARDAGGGFCGALPLILQRRPFYGLPARFLTVPVNDYYTRYDLLAAAGGAAEAAFSSYLRHHGGWDVLCLRYLPENGHGWTFYKAALLQGSRVAAHPLMASPYVRLPGSAAELYAGLGTKFKANLRRRRARLQELGPLELEKWTGGPDFEEKLRIGLQIEQSGWKGEEKTAILSDAKAGPFYLGLAREAAQRGYLRLYFLKSAGKAIAFHFSVVLQGVYLFLKPGYDERYKEYSPGHLLVEDVLKDCIAEGLQEFDFLAEDLAWKREWTETVRPHSTIYLFRDNWYGNLLADIKAKGVPFFRRLIGSGPLEVGVFHK
jgi:CelD/BcsL family acetyltransferase involved in cellulose biosynthesis